MASLLCSFLIVVARCLPTASPKIILAQTPISQVSQYPLYIDEKDNFIGLDIFFLFELERIPPKITFDPTYTLISVFKLLFT